ncbi:hypothetical protein CROQUDRAFT_650703, partial [Cronartium quercuum f. sp. fusiforme G11]
IRIPGKRKSNSHVCACVRGAPSHRIRAQGELLMNLLLLLSLRACQPSNPTHLFPSRPHTTHLFPSL